VQESAIQHLFVITDPVHLSKLLLSILTGKVYYRCAEGEEDGCINKGTQSSTSFCHLVCTRLGGCEVTLPTVMMEVWDAVPLIGFTCFGIAVP
jgi:hypothetical protein